MNETSAEVTGDLVTAEIVVSAVIMVSACCGNTLLIYSILRRRTTKKTSAPGKKQCIVSGNMILHVGVCDLLLVLSSIPVTIAESRLGYFPFGRVGCHLLYPISTFAVNSTSLLLVMLSFERFIAVVYPFNYNRLCNMQARLNKLVHGISALLVLPYLCALRLEKDEGKLTCKESWHVNVGTAYTVLLFVVQYALPLPIITVLYTFTWRRIHLKQPLLDKPTTNLEVSSDIRNRRQAVRLLRLFIAIVVVFAVFMLPNQITWLYSSVTGHETGSTWNSLAYWLTYTSSVLNPIIYGSNGRWKKLKLCLKE